MVCIRQWEKWRGFVRIFLTDPCITEFDIVISPKQVKGLKWTINIDDVTLVGFKKHIREVEKPPTLENDGQC
jgi:hypothetical protein